MPISNWPDEVFTIGINRAVDLLAEKKAKGFNRPKPGALKDLGPHPEGGGNVQVMSGRYGPYVKFGKVNATLPRDMEPTAITMDEAVVLLNARAGKEPAKKKKPVAKKKAPAKKADRPKKAKPTAAAAE